MADFLQGLDPTAWFSDHLTFAFSRLLLLARLLTC